MCSYRLRFGSTGELRRLSRRGSPRTGALAAVASALLVESKPPLPAEAAGEAEEVVLEAAA
jgi:hypothetical protein